MGVYLMRRYWRCGLFLTIDLIRVSTSPKAGGVYIACIDLQAELT